MNPQKSSAGVPVELTVAFHFVADAFSDQQPGSIFQPCDVRDGDETLAPRFQDAVQFADEADGIEIKMLNCFPAGNGVELVFREGQPAFFLVARAKTFKKISDGETNSVGLLKRLDAI